MLNGSETLISDRELETFLDTLDHVFCRCYYADRTVRFEYLSRTIRQWTGRLPDEFVLGARNWLAYIHPSDRQILTDAMARHAHRQDGFAVEYRLVDGDHVRTIRHTARAARGHEDTPIRWNGCMEDISALRQAQQDLERSQLLQNMGRLAAGIAHEINTPIQFIGDNLHFLAEAWEALCLQYRHLNNALKQTAPCDGRQDVTQTELSFILAEAPDAIRQSLDGIERISSLITAMRDFSRLDERRMAVADVNRAINSTLTLLRNELKYIADVHMDEDPALSEVYCSVDEISQAVINLLINGGHSIKEKIAAGKCTRGLIHIRTRRVGDTAEIEIADNGMGIPREVQSRIFERFFTTKRNTQAQGTGQGLAMVRSIIEQHHHGSVTFETEFGNGTTFRLRLPLDHRSQEGQG